MLQNKTAREDRPMPQDALTFRSIRARAVVLKLRRPIVARIMTIHDWPLILIDIETHRARHYRPFLCRAV